MSDWADKLPGNVARIAGLLHLAEHGWAGAPRAVSASTMEVAVEIGDYLISHAQAALSEAAGNPSRAAGVLRWLRAGSIRVVSVREVQNKLGGGGRFPDATIVEAAAPGAGGPRPPPGDASVGSRAPRRAAAVPALRGPPRRLRQSLPACVRGVVDGDQRPHRRPARAASSRASATARRWS